MQASCLQTSPGTAGVTRPHQVFKEYLVHEVRGPDAPRECATRRARGERMPEKTTRKRARAAKRAGKRPTTQAGEFVHEEMKHIRHGKHGARSTKQAIAIGLSKARRAGVKLRRPPA